MAPETINEKGKAICLAFSRIPEPTVQQDDTPHPPPLNPEDGMGEEKPLPEQEQLKAESFFFTEFDPHFGQAESFSEAPTFCNRENVSLHFVQMYS